MTRQKSIILFAALAAFGLLGARLVGLFEDESVSRDVSGLELLTALLGFFLLLSSVIGIVLVVRQKVRPMNEREISEWDTVRRGGRGAYMRRAIIKGVFFGLLAILWPVISDYLKVKSFGPMLYSLWIYIALFLTCVLAAYYAGTRTWNANERDFGAFLQSKPGEVYDSRGSIHA